MTFRTFHRLEGFACAFILIAVILTFMKLPHLLTLAFDAGLIILWLLIVPFQYEFTDKEEGPT
ncbi:hypothetical protein JOD43_000331 [Pullulanibacillus pueri]|nr:hypothetical protein [Pullulanibacillus pueri]